MLPAQLVEEYVLPAQLVGEYVLPAQLVEEYVLPAQLVDGKLADLSNKDRFFSVQLVLIEIREEYNKFIFSSFIFKFQESSKYVATLSKKSFTNNCVNNWLGVEEAPYVLFRIFQLLNKCGGCVSYDTMILVGSLWKQCTTRPVTPSPAAQSHPRLNEKIDQMEQVTIPNILLFKAMTLIGSYRVVL